jgi:hypothetical protein
MQLKLIGGGLKNILFIELKELCNFLHNFELDKSCMSYYNLSTEEQYF